MRAAFQCIAEQCECASSKLDSILENSAQQQRQIEVLIAAQLRQEERIAELLDAQGQSRIQQVVVSQERCETRFAQCEENIAAMRSEIGTLHVGSRIAPPSLDQLPAAREARWTCSAEAAKQTSAEAFVVPGGPLQPQPQASCGVGPPSAPAPKAQDMAQLTSAHGACTSSSGHARPKACTTLSQASPAFESLSSYPVQQEPDVVASGVFPLGTMTFDEILGNDIIHVRATVEDGETRDFWVHASVLKSSDYFQAKMERWQGAGSTIVLTLPTRCSVHGVAVAFRRLYCKLPWSPKRWCGETHDDISSLLGAVYFYHHILIDELSREVMQAAHSLCFAAGKEEQQRLHSMFAAFPLQSHVITWLEPLSSAEVQKLKAIVEAGVMDDRDIVRTLADKEIANLKDRCSAAVVLELMIATLESGLSDIEHGQNHHYRPRRGVGKVEAGSLHHRVGLAWIFRHIASRLPAHCQSLQTISDMLRTALSRIPCPEVTLTSISGKSVYGTEVQEFGKLDAQSQRDLCNFMVTLLASALSCDTGSWTEAELTALDNASELLSCPKVNKSLDPFGFLEGFPKKSLDDFPDFIAQLSMAGESAQLAMLSGFARNGSLEVAKVIGIETCRALLPSVRVHLLPYMRDFGNDVINLVGNIEDIDEEIA